MCKSIYFRNACKGFDSNFAEAWLQTDGIEHYQWICPPCRRASLAIAQGKLFDKETKPAEKQIMPAPEYANSGISEGPLGSEDKENFHP